jgi:nicotinate-nucleotide adenylyltransferase
MNNVAIYGGTFDPPTAAHKGIVETLLFARMVDEVWVIPNFISRDGKDSTGYADRLSMCELMFRNIPGCETMEFAMYAYEEDKEGLGSTYGLMKYLDRKIGSSYPINFSLVIGEDQALNMSSWYKHEELINENNFIVFSRGVESNEKRWYNKYPHRFEHYFNIPCSSTFIRSNVSNEKVLNKMIGNEEVIEYIKEKNFYRS